MQYRKIPVIVDAVQWRGDNLPELCEMDGFLGVYSFMSGELVVRNMEWSHHVSVGDYVIRGVDGGFYTCKASVFEKTYEQVEPGAEDDTIWAGF